MMVTEKIALDGGAVLLVEKRVEDDSVQIGIRTEDCQECLFHWGVLRRGQGGWQLPPESAWPPGTHPFDRTAVQTPFSRDNGEGKIAIHLKEAGDVLSIPFVLYFPAQNRWDNNRGRDYRISMPRTGSDLLFGNPVLADMADTIIERETGNHSWTLMHRFNLCHDLLDRAAGTTDGMALIFVWLRFSAIRQLDWQRNFNTKPRELAHALDRLTHKIAWLYVTEPEGGRFIRLMLTTLGRGGEGQRVRDEILHIMHRHHIKEVSGHFMEEWHQKLHNNTTPDDVVICEAYLEFLRHNGDLNRFYTALEAGGVSKKRLRSYERPIVSDPDFIGYLKEALLHDFGQFLTVLKEVHAGTDFHAAVKAAIPLLDGHLQGLVRDIQSRQHGDGSVKDMVGTITEARRRLREPIASGQGNTRDLLFLDLALEDLLRVSVEGRLHTLSGSGDLVPLVGLIGENLLLSRHEEELDLCLRHWKHLAERPDSGEAWALEAKSVLDRIGRILGETMDQYYQALQPKAEVLGKAFQADSFSVDLFTEEVVRGRPVFLMALLLRRFDPILREKAHLGNWQVISPGRTAGRVEKTPDLRSVQGRTLAHPTVIVTARVSGEEEIPPQVKAVITADPVDIVSHVAIRARNAGVLFATCYDPETLARLESLENDWIQISTNAAGDVEISSEVAEPVPTPRESSRTVGDAVARRPRPVFGGYVARSCDFDRKKVGPKSNNLCGLQGKLPPWIRLPSSVALPFGVFEQVLSDETNTATARQYRSLAEGMDRQPPDARPEALDALRTTVLQLKAPRDLPNALADVMKDTGIPWPPEWEPVWTCIRKVWASKWNERAYLSRKTMGIPHESLFMAVLIQEVVDAQYAFVIHTVHPISNAQNEVFAEVVPGLGETLVGNFPGKALSFSSTKGKDAYRLLSFPSKSFGVFGRGLIFRSDSNGEDLSDYAGAGLYDSVTLNPTRRVLLDYTKAPLLVDQSFQKTFLLSVAKIGIEVEKALGVPQDIEGAFSKGNYYVVQTRPQVGIRKPG
jgi:alpha-glucan,water dikinase